MNPLTRLLVSGLAVLLLAPTAWAGAPALDEATWTKLFGTEADGPAPVFLKDLKKGMTPAEAGAVFKGAAKPSKFGFAKVAIKKVPGLKKMEIYYRKDKVTQVPTALQTVTFTLDPAVMKNPAAYAALVKVLTAKYGPVKKPETVPEYKITWTTRALQSAQVWKIGRDLTFKYSY